MDRPPRWRRLLPSLAVTAWVVLAGGVGVVARSWDAADAATGAGRAGTSSQAFADAARRAAPAATTTTPSPGASTPSATPATTTTTTPGSTTTTPVTAATRPRPAPSSTSTTTPPTAPGRVLVVGDSLTVGAGDELEARLDDAGHEVLVDGAVSRATESAVRILRDLEPTPADLVLVALGTNDPLDPDRFARVILDVVAEAGGAQVLWVDVDRRGYDRLNDVLETAERAGLLELVRWTDVIDEQPELRSSDGVHLDPEGYALRAEVLAEAVACATGSCVATDDPEAPGAEP